MGIPSSPRWDDLQVVERHGTGRGDVVQQIGHHLPSFTLDTYVHLMPNRSRVEPLDLSAELEASEGAAALTA